MALRKSDQDGLQSQGILFENSVHILSRNRVKTLSCKDDNLVPDDSKSILRKAGENKMYVEAIMWYFGMSQQQALDYYNKLRLNGETYRLEQILQAYQNQARLSFYND